MTPLYNHNSRETAYHVDSYPYGRLRCNIWFWIERDSKKGFRFCSQTENPKNGRMNAPKKSTYVKFAGCMYLDENNHVQWSGITEYSSCDEALAFVRKFPGSDLSELKLWAKMKQLWCASVLKKGTLFGSPLSEIDTERFNNELKVWEQVNLECKALEKKADSTVDLLDKSA